MAECTLRVAADAGLVPDPVPAHCSEDRVTILHGEATPVIACGAHTTYDLQSVYRAKRALRYDAEASRENEEI